MLCIEPILGSKAASSRAEPPVPLTEATIRYVARDFSKLCKNTFSSAVYIQSVPWRLCVSPSSSNSQSNPDDKKLGIYLYCFLSPSTGNWSCKAKAVIRLLERKNPERSVSKELDCTWTNGKYGWGYADFIAWSDALNPTKGFVVDDTLVCEAWLKVDPPAITLHSTRIQNNATSHASIGSTISKASPEVEKGSEGQSANCFSEVFIPSLLGYAWVIKKFSKCDKKELKSSIFQTAGKKWNLSIDFPSDEEIFAVKLSFMSCCSRETKAIVDVFLSKKDRKIIKCLSHASLYYVPSHCEMSWKWKPIKKSDIFNKMEKGEDTLVISCRIQMFSYSETWENLARSNIPFKLLDALLADDTFTDFILESKEGKKVNVHKLILAAKSNVFAAMFTHDMKEKSENRVKLLDVEYRTLVLMKHFIYSTKLPPTSESDYLKLMYVANKYELPELKALIEEKLIKEIRIDNAVLLLILSDRYDSKDLKHAVLKFICLNHPKYFIDTEEWRKMIACHPDILDECLRFISKRGLGQISKPPKDSKKEEPQTVLTRILLEDVRFTDVTLISKEGKELQSHRAILSASSNVFKDMLLFAKEKRYKNKASFNDIEFNTLKLVVDFVYGRLPPPITALSDVVKLFAAADKFNFPELKAAMEDQLIAKINPQSAIRLFIASDECNAPKLKNSVLLKICFGSLEDVIGSEEWEELVRTRPNLVNSCFKFMASPEKYCYDISDVYVMHA